MSAKGNLRGHFREYGYDNPPGLAIIAKQSKHIDFYDSLSAIKDEGLPTVFWRGEDSEWLACMRMSDFMELYRAWEGEQNGV